MSDEPDWVHDALASLDRPGMPDAVRDRLDAAIASEAAAGTPAASPRATVPSQAVPHRRPWILAVAGVAAAFVLFGVVDPFGGTLQQPGTGGFDTALAPEATSGSTASGSPASESAPSEPSRSESAPAPVPTQIASVMTVTGTAYTSSSVAEQAVAAAQLNTSAGSPSRSQDAAEPPLTTDVAAAAACVAALPGDGEVVLVDRAAFDGQQALVVVRRSGTTFEVFVQDLSCTAQDAAIRFRATVEAP